MGPEHADSILIDSIRVRGLDYQVMSAGSGELVTVTTHQYARVSGLGSSWLRALAMVGRVVAVNAPADVPDADRSSLGMQSLADALDEVRLALGISRWVVAGASTGGMVALIHALRHAPAVRGLVLVGTAASARYVSSPDCIYNSRHPSHARALGALLTAASSRASPEERQRAAKILLGLSVYRPESVERLLASSAPGESWSAPRLGAFVRQLAGPEAFDVTPRLHEIGCPALIVGGLHDQQCPVSESRSLHAGLSRSELVVFEESGHLPYWEESERFVRVLSSFYQRHFGEQAS